MEKSEYRELNKARSVPKESEDVNYSKIKIAFGYYTPSKEEVFCRQLLSDSGSCKKMQYSLNKELFWM